MLPRTARPMRSLACNIVLIFISAFFISTAARARAVDLPPGWFLAGQQPAAYDAGLDHAETHGGKASGFIRANVEKPLGMGTLMQLFEPGPFKEKRVRMSAFVKTSNVSDWAAMWMRVDDATGEIAFDNMQGRPLTGTADWQRCEIVLDVPATATRIALGVLLNGSGTVWMSELKLEPVGDDVASTDLLAERAPPLGSATNIGFDEHGKISGAVNYGYDVSFDDNQVVGAGTHVIRRADGSWAGTVGGREISLTEHEGNLDGAEVHLSETRTPGRTEIGGLWFGDRLTMVFEPKAISIRLGVRESVPTNQVGMSPPGAQLSSQLDLVYSEPGIYQNASVSSMKVGVFGDAARADPPLPQTLFAFLALIRPPAGYVRLVLDVPHLRQRANGPQETREHLAHEEHPHHAAHPGGVLTSTPHLNAHESGAASSGAAHAGAHPGESGGPSPSAAHAGATGSAHETPAGGTISGEPSGSSPSGAGAGYSGGASYSGGAAGAGASSGSSYKR